MDNILGFRYDREESHRSINRWLLVVAAGLRPISQRSGSNFTPDRALDTPRRTGGAIQLLFGRKLGRPPPLFVQALVALDRGLLRAKLHRLFVRLAAMKTVNGVRMFALDTEDTVFFRELRPSLNPARTLADAGQG